MEKAMLKYFEVKNFRKFKDKLMLDLTAAQYTFNSECVKNGCVKTALIYGENATGKSTLGWALFDIIRHLTDNSTGSLPKKNYLNAGSDEDVASFRYSFVFNESTVDYSYEKDTNKRILKEQLDIDGKTVISYQVGKAFISDLKGTETLNKTIEKDLNLSALKYVFNNTNLDQRNKANKVFKSFMAFVSNMLIFRTLLDGITFAGYTNSAPNIYQEILRRDNLNDFQEFLNDCGIQCELAKTEDEGEASIGFKFNNRIIPINAIGSTGTKSLALFYFWWQELRENKVSLLFIDEFDASYHFKLSQQIVKRLKKIDSQVILASHNTSLLDNDLIRPDCGFIIDHRGVSSLHNKTTKELREAHNIEKMYRAGSFDEGE